MPLLCDASSTGILLFLLLLVHTTLNLVWVLVRCFNLHWKLRAEQVSTSWEHYNLRSRHNVDCALAHLEWTLEYTLTEGYMIWLEQGIECGYIWSSHEWLPLFKRPGIEVICLLDFFLVVPVSHYNQAQATFFYIDSQLCYLLLAQVVLNVDQEQGFVILREETCQRLVQGLQVIATAREPMVQTLEVREEAVSEPLERFLFRIFQNVVLPDEAILRVI